MDDYKAIAVTPFCACISSVSKCGCNWGVAEVATYASIKLMLNSQKTVWLEWKVHVNGNLVFMFGFESTDQPGRYHSVIELRNKLILSEPQSQPENNLPTTDSRCFKVLSSNEWCHVESGLFVTHNDGNEVFLERGNDRAGKYRLE